MRANKVKILKLARCTDTTAKQHKGYFHEWFTKSAKKHPSCPKCFGHKTLVVE